jgi:hypothetical protein
MPTRQQPDSPFLQALQQLGRKRRRKFGLVGTLARVETAGGRGSAEALAHHERCFNDPAAIQAVCEDYLPRCACEIADTVGFERCAAALNPPVSRHARDRLQR